MKDYEVLLDKFWKGQASEPEKLQLYKIMTENEGAIKAALQQEYESDNKAELAPGASDKLLESLHREIGNRAARSIEMPQRKAPRLFRWAAALLVIVLASFFTWRYYQAVPADNGKSALAAAFRVIDNKGPGVKELVMSDGSAVRLYPNSSIRFRQPFHAGPVRSIDLEGKAEFNVHHDASRPFEVIASNLKTTDIGTVFMIDAPDEHSFRLALTEGSVRLAAMPNSGVQMEDMILQPGDEARWDDSGRKMVLAKAIPKQQVTAEAPVPPAPAKARLVFDKTPLAEVFAKLEAREQIPISCSAAEVKELTFTGTIEPTDSIDTTLKIICNLNGLNYQKTKQAFVITRNK